MKHITAAVQMFVLVCLLLLLSGCEDKSNQKLETLPIEDNSTENVENQTEQKEEVKAEQKNSVEGEYRHSMIAGWDLNLKSDGTAEHKMQDKLFTGTWRLNGSDLVVDVPEFMRMPMKLTVRGDEFYDTKNRLTFIKK